MKLISWTLDIAASLMVLLAVLIFLTIRKQMDFMSEHAGNPLSGIDPARVIILLSGAFLIWRLFV